MSNSLSGRVETLSTEFALGWAEADELDTVYVYALLNGKIIGTAPADQIRPDLLKATEQRGKECRAFLILFIKAVADHEVQEIEVRAVHSGETLPNAQKLRVDQTPICQIFVFGSPRSGTSELGNTISTQLSLPWLGECHAAPLFAKAAEALDGDAKHLNGFPRFMANEQFGKYAVDRARLAYFKMHGSASFLDKTPGSPMIASAPFIYRAFPQAKFIYLQRNGISNVLSRMVKFGGNFNSHCADWAAAVNTWWDVRSKLPHSLEVSQEDMLNDPEKVARQVSDYLGKPEKVEAIVNSLKVGSRERTGAGLHRDTFRETGWSDEQIKVFKRICGPTMERLGYDVR